MGNLCTWMQIKQLSSSPVDGPEDDGEFKELDEYYDSA